MPRDLPDHMREKIRQQYSGDPEVLRAVGFVPRPTATMERESSHPHRSSRRAADARWPEHAARVRATMETRNVALTIWLPGLKLYSENVALRGDKRVGQESRNKIKVQSAASAEAHLAFQNCDSDLYRITERVAITILQHGKSRAIDPGNLFHKPAIDCLLERNGGLGIIVDDSAKYVSTVTIGYGDRELTGVEIVIIPSGEHL